MSIAGADSRGPTGTEGTLGNLPLCRGSPPRTRLSADTCLCWVYAAILWPPVECNQWSGALSLPPERLVVSWALGCRDD